ncbi:MULTISPECIES: Lrp/AsnC family transcriptional regulator [Actinomadura]|uniref:Winged helix-turn-helix transcriptional regulator n=1 Tax=Actinomadura litoris TaxID=2678616 RepID=A0A7K1KUD9_9ACTN|nr:MULTISPECIES: Lrp/AsnC family transcriptional regulator [Actinomadura]MBT2207560.1 Lrp/AsnC family transcriptional regulator [Actinomadura sp. NEAU-AAG7]MUN35647.1 winged helix-turn-helix transcriptional regulator [Actinomadura litoris]
MELSRADLEILVALQENSRLTNRELAKRLGAAESTTHERLRRLVRGGVIKRFTAEIDLAALGRPMQAMIAVRLRPQSEDVVERFLRTVMDDPCVVDAIVVSGEIDVLLRVAVQSAEHLRTFAWRKVTSAKSVQSITTHLVYEYRRRPITAPP